MASVTQKIPNYIVGMSEQPDELKLPGQTTDLLNCVPDVVNQVVKRPGSRFVQNVENEVGAEWFNYYRDEQEQYIGCVKKDGTVRIWSAIDGTEKTVTQTAATQAYMSHVAEEQLQPLTVSDITYVTNRQRYPRMTTAKTPVLPYEGYAEVKVLAYGRTYEFTINPDGGTAQVITSTTPNTPTNNTDPPLDVSDILADWDTALQAAGYTTQICGNGIYFITTAAKFNLSLNDTVAINGFSDSISDFSRLPFQGRTGHRVKVSNTSDATEDDFWVEFEADEGDFGEGVWNEILQPDALTTIDPATMPHAIVRTGNGTFEVTSIDWTTRQSGVIEYQDVTIGGTTYTIEDPGGTTNPLPSFINEFPDTLDIPQNRKPINKLLLFRNRLVFLSNENVVLSQSGSFISVFADSTIVLSAQDPIDITAASQKPALLFDGVEQNNGLVLFGETQQYLLSSDDSTVGLTQDTIRLGTIGYYLYDKEVNPINMGTSVGFANMGGRSFRFFEMTNITIDGEPNVTEVSKTVSQLLPNELTQIADSQEGSQLFFSNKDTGRENEVWGFRYYTVGDRRYQNAWHRWILPGNVIYHCIMRDTYYAVVRFGTQNRILEFDIKISDETKYYGDYRIHMDNMVDIPDTGSFQGGSVITPGLPPTYPGDKTDTVFPIPLSSTGPVEAEIEDVGEGYTTATGVATDVAGLTVDIVADPGSTPAGALTSVIIAGGTAPPGTVFNITQGGASGGTAVFPDQRVITEITLPTVVYKASLGQFKAVEYVLKDGVWYGVFNDVTQEYVGTEFVVGYLFNMQVEIPKFYRTSQDQTANVVKSDTRASLIVHRFVLDAGATGVFDCNLQRLGYADYIEKFEANTMDSYKANSPNLKDQVTRTIPCYCRNVNMNITLSSQHPSPFTLYSIAWEGDYTNKFYRSV